MNILYNGAEKLIQLNVKNGVFSKKNEEKFHLLHVLWLYYFETFFLSYTMQRLHCSDCYKMYLCHVWCIEALKNEPKGRSLRTDLSGYVTPFRRKADILLALAEQPSKARSEDIPYGIGKKAIKNVTSKEGSR